MKDIPSLMQGLTSARHILGAIQSKLTIDDTKIACIRFCVSYTPIPLKNQSSMCTYYERRLEVAGEDVNNASCVLKYWKVFLFQV